MTNTVFFQSKTWRVLQVKTADEVLATYPDKSVGETMLKHDFELLVIEELEQSQSKNLGVLIIFEQRRRRGVFRNQSGDIFDPDDFHPLTTDN